MLNYRNATQVAPQVSLDDFLSDKVKQQAIAGKVVLIGYVGHDSIDTWHSLGKIPKMPGVTIHAQMTSNILSHILDDRSLITTWCDLAEFAWILLWSGVGSVIWFRFRGFQIWIVGAGAMVILVVSYGVYLGIRSIWIPLIPAGMAVVLTPLVAMVVDRSQLKSGDDRDR
jgi:CHASE2 domain-containing sensor protein